MKTIIRTLILAAILSAPSANAISKADLLACMRGEQPPSGVVCPVR